MKKGEVLYIEGDSPLQGYYEILRGSNDLFKLGKLNGEYRGIPNHKGQVYIKKGDIKERTCARIKFNKKKSLTGILSLAPVCSSSEERHFLELRNGSSRKK